MNNVCIVGIAHKEIYLKALLKYCEPEELVLHVFQNNNTTDLHEAANQLHAEIQIVLPDDKPTLLNQVICFTNYIGISEVMAIEDANKAGVDFIVVNPFKEQ